MSVREAVGACLGAATCLLLAATWGYEAWIKLRDAWTWQRTARQAARTSTEPEQAEFDTKFDLIIATEYPTRTPHRRTEEP